MCRLFGFRSVIPSQVHSSLVEADNALSHQSKLHPDGWGVAYYVDGTPHVTKSPMTALSDALFHRLSGVVASETVVAHIRQATQGKNNVLNCHPFQYGHWIGAHNGDVPNLAEKRGELLELIAPRFRRFVLGETDSELIFLQFISHLADFGPLDRNHSMINMVAALRKTVKNVRQLCDTEEHRALLTLMLTDGRCLVATHGGKPLLFSTYKQQCPERSACASYSDVCERPTTSGFVNHFIISSERLQGQNVWHELEEGEVIAVDHRMQVFRGSLADRHLTVLQNSAQSEAQSLTLTASPVQGEEVASINGALPLISR